MRIAQSHIGRIRALLRGALAMYPTLPNVLSDNFHRTIYITPDVSEDTFIIPMVCGYYTTGLISTYKTLGEGYPDVFTPVYVDNSDISEYRNITCGRILQTMASHPTLYELLPYHINGDLYYIGKGIILDSKFSPVIIIAVKLNEVGIPSNHIITRIKPISFELYVTDRIIYDMPKSITKYVTNTLIPAFVMANSPYKINHVIVSNDINKFVHMPVLKAGDSCNISAIAKELLKRNKQSVINNLYHGPMET